MNHWKIISIFRFYNSSKFQQIFLAYHSVDEQPEIYMIYWRTEQKCRQFTKKFSYIIYLNGILIIPIMQSIYDIATGHYDTSAWALQVRISILFNTESIWGWYLLLFININIAISYFRTILSIVSSSVTAFTSMRSVITSISFLELSKKMWNWMKTKRIAWLHEKREKNQGKYLQSAKHSHQIPWVRLTWNSNSSFIIAIFPFHQKTNSK